MIFQEYLDVFFFLLLFAHFKRLGGHLYIFVYFPINPHPPLPPDSLKGPRRVIYDPPYIF